MLANIDKTTRTAIMATSHCLIGCGIGEVLGMVITNSPHRKTGPSIFVSVILAFLIGYSLALRPLLKSGMPPKRALKTALAADTVSIASMEITDNVVLLLMPAALYAPITAPIFWFGLAISLGVAFLVTVPVNRWLIVRGQGHALMHDMH
jgi:Domain of unknown function (DUF4396)